MFRELEDRGANVRGAVRNFDKADKLKLNRDHLVYFDYSKPETFEEAFRDISRVLFIAPPGDPNAYSLIVPAIDHAINAKVDQIVVLSVYGADRSDEIPLRKIEKHVETSRIPYTFIRPNFFMQNFTTGFLAEFLKTGSIILPAGDGKTSFIDVRDIGEVITTVLTEKGHENKIYNITGPEALDHYEVASLLSEYLDKDIKYNPISEDAMRKALKARGTPDASIDFMIGLYIPVKNGKDKKITKDVKRVIGRKPRNFEQFLEDYTKDKIPAIAA